MNKRIQELAEQAGLYIKLNEKFLPKAMSAEECNDAYLKFAELIVRECADMFRGVYTDQVRQERIDKRIKEHFGVE